MGRAWRLMIPSAVAEAREVLVHDGPASAYTGVTTDVLLATGGRSQAYFAHASAALARALPRARHVVIPKADHNSITGAGAPFVERFVGFLDGTT